MASTEDVAELLAAWSRGSREAGEQLFALVYDELKRLARSQLRRERDEHTLQPTALVHEAYLRLAGQNVQWQNRHHFFSIAAQSMRRVLVDHARAHLAAKRGGGLRITLHEDIAAAQPESDLLALEAALQDLETLDPRQARVVELRYFAGLSIEETAQVLEVSTATVKREWSLARAWIHRALEGQKQP